MRRARVFLVLLCTLICAASVNDPSWSALRPQPESVPSLPLQRQMMSPDEDPSGNRMNVAPVIPAAFGPRAAPDSEIARKLAGYAKPPAPPPAIPYNWGTDVLVSSFDDVVRNAEFDFDVLDGTLYAYLWRDWGVYPEHRFYRSTNGGQTWEWRTGSTYEPLTFTDSDFVYCDSIAIAVCGFKHGTGHTITADRFNMEDLTWDPGHLVFYSTTASDSIYSLALATDYDNYAHNAYVYLVAHIGNKIHFWRSLDKGKTWVDHAILATGNVWYPDVAYAWLSGGKIYVTYSADETIYLARNTAFGSSTAWVSPWHDWNILQTYRMPVVAAVRDTVQVFFEHDYWPLGVDEIEARVTMDGGATWLGALLTSNSATHLYPDATARGGVFRIAYFEFEGSERRVMYNRCRNVSITQWESPLAMNDHSPYWDRKPFGNPCVEAMPGGAAGIMYTGLYENRKAWFDFESNVPTGLAEDLVQARGLNVFANPTRGPVSLSFDIEEDQDASLVVYDISGRRVANLVSGRMSAGQHSAVWNPTGCADGIYFVMLTTAQAKETRKLILLQ